MRQTNNAIKFLLAQYRAIYKRAFVLGLATTAVLSMGVANAEEAAPTTSFTFEKDTTYTTDSSKLYAQTGEGEKTEVNLEDTNVTVSEGSILLNGITGEGNTFALEGATFDITADEANTGGLNSRLGTSGSASDLVNILVSGDNVIADKFTIATNTVFKQDGESKGSITVNGLLTQSREAVNNTDLSGANVFINAGNREGSEANGIGGLKFDNKVTVGNLTFGNNTFIGLNDDLRTNDSDTVSNYENGSLTGSKTTATYVDNKEIAIKDGTVSFTGTTHILGTRNNTGVTDEGNSNGLSGVIAGIQKNTLTFSKAGTAQSATVKVEEGANLNLHATTTVGKGVDLVNNGTITINQAIEEGAQLESTALENYYKAGAIGTAGGELVLNGYAQSNTGTVINNNNLTIASGDNVFDAGELTNAGTIAVNGGTLSVADVNDLGLNATGNKAQVNIAKNATLALGDAELTVDNLASSAGEGKISFTDATSKATFADLTVNGTEDGTNTLDIGSGSITADSLNLSYVSSEANGDGGVAGVSTFAEEVSNNIFTIASGNYTLGNLTAEGANTVQIGDADSSATVKLVGSGNDLGALNITLNGQATDFNKLNINEGTWTNGGALTVTKGTATIAKDANATFASLKTTASTGVANISGSLTVGALTAGASSVSVDGGSLTATDKLSLAADSVKVTNAGSVTVNAGNVYSYDADAGEESTVSLVTKDGLFTKDAINTDLTSKLVITGETEMTKDKFDAIKAAISKDSDSAFNGLLEFAGVTWTDKPEADDIVFSEDDMNGVAGYYDKTNVTVSDGTIASGTYDFGTVQVETDNLTLGDGSGAAGLTLSNANGGNFVSTNDDKVAGVAFATDKSQLALKGDGNIGAITANNGGNGNVIIAGGNVSVVNSADPNQYADIGSSEDNKSVGSVNVQGGQLNVGSLYTNSLTSSGNIIATGDIVVGTNGGTITGGKVVAGGELTVKGDLNVVGTTDVVADTLNVDSGATFFLDPDWQYDATVGSFKDLSLAGQMIISKNTLAYFGDNLSQSEVRSNLASRLSETGVQALAYVDKAITVGNGTSGQLIVDPTSTGTTTKTDAVYVAEGSQLVVTGNALADGAAITVNTSNKDVTVNGTLALENVAVKDEQKFNIFSGATSVTASNVTVDNKLYEASLSNGTVTINYDSDNAAANLAQTNASIANLVNTFAKNGGTFNQEATDGVGFVSKAVALDSAAQIGTALDSAALFVVAGGAPQVTLLAQNASTKAVESRLGFNADSSNMVVSEGVDASVWLSPIYSSTDMDGLDAGARSYGVDADLFGVAVGSDFNVANSAKFGLMFNIGSGSSDSQGNVAATSNDFDYMGVGLYGAYDYENFSIMGDLNYTVVDSDIDQYNQVQKLEGNVDSTAFSVGVQGKYTFAFDVIDVVPHLGVRYTALSVDDYTLGTTIRGDSIDQDIVTFPIGVTFSKEIAAGSWMVKPLVDFSVIPAAGDTDTDVDVNFINFGAASVNADIVDSVSYGATLGLQVENNNFGFGLNVGYLGSENADSYNVSANARYMF